MPSRGDEANDILLNDAVKRALAGGKCPACERGEKTIKPAPSGVLRREVSDLSSEAINNLAVDVAKQITWEEGFAKWYLACAPIQRHDDTYERMMAAFEAGWEMALNNAEIEEQMSETDKLELLLERVAAKTYSTPPVKMADMLKRELLPLLQAGQALRLKAGKHFGGKVIASEYEAYDAALRAQGAEI